MATDTPELTALAEILKSTVAAVYLPATGRVLRCPNPWHPPVHCDRELSFTVPEAQLLAARILGGELGQFPAGADPIVLAYGIPWSAT